MMYGLPNPIMVAFNEDGRTTSVCEGQWYQPKHTSIKFFQVHGLEVPVMEIGGLVGGLHSSCLFFTGFFRMKWPLLIFSQVVEANFYCFPQMIRYYYLLLTRVAWGSRNDTKVAKMMIKAGIDGSQAIMVHRTNPFGTFMDLWSTGRHRSSWSPLQKSPQSFPSTPFSAWF